MILKRVSMLHLWLINFHQTTEGAGSVGSSIGPLGGHGSDIAKTSEHFSARCEGVAYTFCLDGH